MASKSFAYWWKNVWVRSSDMGLHQLRGLGDNVLKGRDGKILKYLPYLPLGSIEVHVRLEGAAAAHGQARMSGIDFAWVNVEDHGPALAQHFMRLLLDEPIGKQAQITASEEAHRLRHHLGHRDGKLHQGTLVSEPMRFAPAVLHATMAARRRKYRGIVPVARFRER